MRGRVPPVTAIPLFLLLLLSPSPTMRLPSLAFPGSSISCIFESCGSSGSRSSTSSSSSSRNCSSGSGSGGCGSSSSRHGQWAPARGPTGAMAHGPLGPSCVALQRRLRTALRDIRRRYGADVVARSVSVEGSDERFAALFQKLLSGKSVVVAAVGGSISAAGHLPDGMLHGTGTYGAAFVDWLNKVFPTPPGALPHSLHRAVLAGAGSFALHYCTAALFDRLWAGVGDGREGKTSSSSPLSSSWEQARHADVFLLELAANDWALLQPGMTPPAADEQYLHAECLVRQLLSLPSSPLVLFLHFGVHHPENHVLSSYLSNAEPLLNVVASYYGLPAVSMWRAFFPLATSPLLQAAETAGDVGASSSSTSTTTGSSRLEAMTGQSSSAAGMQGAAAATDLNLTFSRLFIDRVHPNAEGHTMAGSLAVHRVLSVFVKLLRRRVDSERNGNENLEEGGVEGRLVASSVSTSTGCPLRSLCDECTGGHGATSLLSHPILWPTPQSVDEIPPLQCEADPAPVCQLANQWHVTAVGSRKFPNGLLTTGDRYKGGGGWVLKECGPLVPQLKCWKAEEAGAPLEVQVDLRRHQGRSETIVASEGCEAEKGRGEGGGARGLRLNVLYKMMHAGKEEYRGAGADVYVDGALAGWLGVQVPGNTLTHWYLNSSMFVTVQACDVVTLTIVPRTKFFHLVAIVAG